MSTHAPYRSRQIVALVGLLTAGALIGCDDHPPATASASTSTAMTPTYASGLQTDGRIPVPSIEYSIRRDIDPTDALAAYTHSLITFRLDEVDDDDAILTHLLERCRLNPRDYGARSRLAHMAWQEGEADVALAWLTEAFDAEMSYTNVHHFGSDATTKRDLIAHFRRMASQDPSDYLSVRIASLLYDLGDLDAAEQQLTTLLSHTPTNALALRLRGQIRSTSGNSSGAILDFDAALDADPTMLGALFRRGEAAMEMDELTQAIRDYGRVWDAAPWFPLSVRERGRARWLAGDDEGATNDFMAFLLASPDSSASPLGEEDLVLRQCNERLRRDPGSAFTHFYRAAILGGRGEFDGAINDLKQAIRLAPDQPLYHMYLGQAYFNAIGAGYDQPTMLDLARESAERALERDDELPRAELLLGHIALRNGRFRAAMNHFEAVAAAVPTSAGCWLNASQALAKLDKPEQAAAAVSIAVGLDSSFQYFRSAFMADLDVVRMRLADLAESPRTAIWLWEAGNAAATQGENSAAIEGYSMCVAIDDSFGAAWINLGVLRAIEGDRERGIRDLYRGLAAAERLTLPF